ncbi:HET-domain-containing protein [Mytilinidion resinicola]|uniref:HET-domain-containing protein n=1 Tax=Mytilinidion resinicola TaxID=574789 RepID=A0A6A6YZ51_9PEZI|nr:HET-domain-containing protein [Mytilinidion resinicola]KAF2814216.1 HET-domain-containing protein [Mytilinidion resinicola]
MSYVPYPEYYLDLPSDSIRLLRLLPNEDKRAPIQSKLFTYSLRDWGKRTHPYDALSYVWGSWDNPQSISISEQNFENEHVLPVTRNLHEALSRLRHRSIDRILWIDAICINQKNDREKEQQIQFMAKIYAQADRVVVWLGETADGSDRALEEMRVAGGKKSTDSFNSEAIPQAVVALLQRPWFQRIWVLQEAAAARHVLIMCGSAEIDGYAFCLGVDSFLDSYKLRADLQSVARSVTYLIRGAIFRPKYSMGRLSRSTLDISSLDELMDMYHARQATMRHDKVYALLGMSSDDLSNAGLSPSYEVPWEDLFQRLVKYLLCQKISVETWCQTEIAVVRSKGCVLGKVSSVQSNIGSEDRQGVDVMFMNIWGQPKNTEVQSEHWNLHASAKSIQNGDIICLLQGTSKPLIIRLCKDHFDVVMIAFSPPEKIPVGDGYIEWPKLLQSETIFTRDFMLVWDWNISHPKEYEALIQTSKVAYSGQ